MLSIIGWVLLILSVLAFIGSFSKNKETGEPLAKEPKKQRTAAVIIFLVSLLIIGADGNDSKKEVDINISQGDKVAVISSIKSLDSRILNVSIHPQVPDFQTFFIEIEMKSQTFWGDGKDWNAVASDAFRVSQKILSKPEVVRIRFVFKTENIDKQLIDWCSIQWHKKDLPQSWDKMTYLEFFSRSKPLSHIPKAGRWLCEFYQDHKDARPTLDGSMPNSCSDYKE